MSTLMFLIETLLVALVVLVPLLCLISQTFRFNMIMTGYGLCITGSCIISSLLSLPSPFDGSSAEPFVIVANHQSALDVFTMTHCWPKNCVSLLKSSLKYIPGFNLCTYLCHAVYVDRFNRKEAKNSLVNVMDAIVNHKRKVFIYPEGSRHASPDEEFLPFKMGAFVIAKRANIPIVPVVFSSYQPFYDYTSSKFERNGHVVIEALEPIDSRDFETANELAAATRERMHETYKRLNAEMRKVGSTKAH
ncbi:hypothetical protein QR680_017523 [Steinernema hermaphroditum]|uniref:1-acylglycerol-3-phosphate O-acyltransferase n=1 Tax=Steinernema hermaphroditum TaxID=289476 RepID=A0AA39LNT2_9BILA|nr:hypothetical protein QR680_017523 [Steinernema hermaphroditum]